MKNIQIEYEYLEGLPNFSNAKTKIKCDLEDGETKLEALIAIKRIIVQNLVDPVDDKGVHLRSDRTNLLDSIARSKRLIVRQATGLGAREAQELLLENNHDYIQAIEAYKEKENEGNK